MKLIGLILCILLTSVKLNAQDININNYIQLNVGLISNREKGAVTVIYKIKNVSTEVLAFSSTAANLDLHMPHAFSIIEKGYGIEKALKYLGSVPIETHRKKSLSKYKLYPGDIFFIRNPLSQYYQIKIDTNYDVDTSVGFTNECGDKLVGAKLTFLLADNSDDNTDITWIDSVMADTWILDIKN